MYDQDEYVLARPFVEACCCFSLLGAHQLPTNRIRSPSVGRGTGFRAASQLQAPEAMHCNSITHRLPREHRNERNQLGYRHTHGTAKTRDENKESMSPIHRPLHRWSNETDESKKIERREEGKKRAICRNELTEPTFSNAINTKALVSHTPRVPVDVCTCWRFWTAPPCAKYCWA